MVFWAVIPLRIFTGSRMSKLSDQSSRQVKSMGMPLKMVAVSCREDLANVSGLFSANSRYILNPSMRDQPSFCGVGFYQIPVDKEQ